MEFLKIFKIFILDRFLEYYEFRLENEALV